MLKNTLRRAMRLRALAKDYLRSSQWAKRPQTLSFEITAACDARCIYCPRLDMDRPMKAMAMPLFRRMIDQASSLRIPDLCPNGYGEICTIPVPQLTEYLTYMKSASHPFRILLNTNGNRLDEERAELFIKHGIHSVNITIDGATAETAETVRKNLDFERIESNVKRLLAMRKAAGKKRPRVRVAMVVSPHTLPEIDAFCARWKGVADTVGLGGFSTRLSSIREGVSKSAVAEACGDKAPTTEAHPCVLPFRDLNIWSDGKAVLCCEDWNAEYVVGDLNDETIDEIWHGEKLTEARRKHLRCAGAELPICAKCNTWQPPSRGAKLWS